MQDKPQKQNTNDPQISKKDFALMLTVAIFFDVVLAVIQLIPIVGSVAASVFNVIPFIGFFIWYQLLGLDFKKPKKAFTFFGCSLIEFIPVINALPGWTSEVVIMYIMQKKDDILAKAVGVVGGAAGATAIAGTGAKMLGAKNLGKSLTQTSETLKSEAQNMRNSMAPTQNLQNRVVGNEVKNPNDSVFREKTKAKHDNDEVFKEKLGGPAGRAASVNTMDNSIENIKPFSNASK